MATTSTENDTHDDGHDDDDVNGNRELSGVVVANVWYIAKNCHVRFGGSTGTTESKFPQQYSVSTSAINNVIVSERDISFRPSNDEAVSVSDQIITISWDDFLGLELVNEEAKKLRGTSGRPKSQSLRHRNLQRANPPHTTIKLTVRCAAKLATDGLDCANSHRHNDLLYIFDYNGSSSSSKQDELNASVQKTVQQPAHGSPASVRNHECSNKRSSRPLLTRLYSTAIRTSSRDEQEKINIKHNILSRSLITKPQSSSARIQKVQKTSPSITVSNYTHYSVERRVTTTPSSSISWSSQQQQKRPSNVIAQLMHKVVRNTLLPTLKSSSSFVWSSSSSLNVKKTLSQSPAKRDNEDNNKKQVFKLIDELSLSTSTLDDELNSRSSGIDMWEKPTSEKRDLEMKIHTVFIMCSEINAKRLVTSVEEAVAHWLVMRMETNETDRYWRNSGRKSLRSLRKAPPTDVSSVYHGDLPTGLQGYDTSKKVSSSTVNTESEYTAGRSALPSYSNSSSDDAYSSCSSGCASSSAQHPPSMFGSSISPAITCRFPYVIPSPSPPVITGFSDSDVSSFVSVMKCSDRAKQHEQINEMTKQIAACKKRSNTAGDETKRFLAGDDTLHECLIGIAQKTATPPAVAVASGSVNERLSEIKTGILALRLLAILLTGPQCTSFVHGLCESDESGLLKSLMAVLLTWPDAAPQQPGRKYSYTLAEDLDRDDDEHLDVCIEWLDSSATCLYALLRHAKLAHTLCSMADKSMICEPDIDQRSRPGQCQPLRRTTSCATAEAAVAAHSHPSYARTVSTIDGYVLLEGCDSRQYEMDGQNLCVTITDSSKYLWIQSQVLIPQKNEASFHFLTRLVNRGARMVTSEQSVASGYMLSNEQTILLYKIFWLLREALEFACTMSRCPYDFTDRRGLAVPVAIADPNVAALKKHFLAENRDTFLHVIWPLTLKKLCPSLSLAHGLITLGQELAQKFEDYN